MKPEQPKWKRRRKRRKKNPEGTNTKRTAHWNLKDYCNDEDVPRFQTEEEDPIAPPTSRKLDTSSLLRLLRQRELGSGWNASRREEWQSQMLIRPLDEDQARKEWRPYASRSVPFTSLKTPRHAAVLSIDRHGNYAMALNDLANDQQENGGNNDQASDAESPVLALTFYGEGTPHCFLGIVCVKEN